MPRLDLGHVGPQRQASADPPPCRHPHADHHPRKVLGYRGLPGLPSRTATIAVEIPRATGSPVLTIAARHPVPLTMRPSRRGAGLLRDGVSKRHMAETATLDLYAFPRFSPPGHIPPRGTPSTVPGGPDTAASGFSVKRCGGQKLRDDRRPELCSVAARCPANAPPPWDALRRLRPEPG